MPQFSDFDSYIAARAAGIHKWAQGIHEEIFKLAPDSVSTADVTLPEGLTVMRPTLARGKNVSIELKGGKERSFLRMEGMERTKWSGPFWNKRLDLNFAPSEIALTLPGSPQDEAAGISERIVTVRFGIWGKLTHISMLCYHKSPSLVTQEILEEQDQLGMGRVKVFYRNHKTSISVTPGRGEGAPTGGNIHLEGGVHYSLTEWPSLARRNVTINPKWDLQSGKRLEIGLKTTFPSDSPIASAAQLFQVGMDYSTETWKKIQELCDACPEVINLEDWLDPIVSFITATGLSVTTVPSARPRASLVTETAQMLPV